MSSTVVHLNSINLTNVAHVWIAVKTKGKCFLLLLPLLPQIAFEKKTLGNPSVNSCPKRKAVCKEIL